MRVARKYIFLLSLFFCSMYIRQSHAMSSETLKKLQVAGKCLPVLATGALGGAVGNAWCSGSAKGTFVCAGAGIAACSVGGIFYAVHDKMRPRQRELISVVARESARFGLIGFFSGACVGLFGDNAVMGALAGAAVPGYIIYKALE